MPIDPLNGRPTDPEQRTADRLAELERRVRRLEGANPSPAVTVGSGAPTASAANLAEGTRYIDRAGTGRLYFVVAGAWRSVALA